MRSLRSSRSVCRHDLALAMLGSTLAAGLLAAIAAAPAIATTGPWVENPESKVRLVSGWSAVPEPEGATSEVDLDLGVEFELAPGWHVYWKNSGDAGYAPKLDLTPTVGLSESRLLFPAPHRFELPGGLVSFGYESAVIYPVTGKLNPPEQGRLAISGRLDYLVCAKECIPYLAELRLDLPARDPSSGSIAPESDDAARLARFRAELPIPEGRLANSPRVSAKLAGHASQASVLELSVAAEDFRMASPDLFFESHGDFALGRPELSIAGDGLRFRVPVRPLDETRPVEPTATFVWTLTGLEGSTGPVAFEGRSTVPMPTPTPSRRILWIVALAAVVGGVVALRHRFSRSVHPQPKEAS